MINSRKTPCIPVEAQNDSQLDIRRHLNLYRPENRLQLGHRILEHHSPISKPFVISIPKFEKSLLITVTR